jgi:Mor family transcriptional regulator
MKKPAIKKEHLPEPLQKVAEVIGMAALIQIIEIRGNEYIYIPKLETLDAKQRNDKIVTNFQGDNIPEISQTYNLTETAIRNVLSCQRTMQFQECA